MVLSFELAKCQLFYILEKILYSGRWVDQLKITIKFILDKISKGSVDYNQ